jgi:hypothetical protein
MHTSLGFVKDRSRRPPANTYVKPATALAGKERRGRFPERQFQENPSEIVPRYTEFSLAYSPQYRVSYRYSRVAGGWLRLLNGRPHRDRADDQPLVAANVIVQYAPHRDLRDRAGHIAVELVGRGRAEYFLGPNYSSGTWEKSGLDAATVFRDEDGRPIRPVRGNTWVQIVRLQTELEK